MLLENDSDNALTTIQPGDSTSKDGFCVGQETPLSGGDS